MDFFSLIGVLFLSSVGIYPASPTVLVFSEGSNQILGSNGSLDTAVRDYVTFTVPNGLSLTAINMLDTSPLGSIGFIGIEAGNQLTLPPSTMTAAGLLGWLHYTPANKNTGIFPLIGSPKNGSSGFTTALPVGAPKRGNSLEFPRGQVRLAGILASPSGLVIRGRLVFPPRCQPARVALSLGSPPRHAQGGKP